MLRLHFVVTMIVSISHAQNAIYCFFRPNDPQCQPEPEPEPEPVNICDSSPDDPSCEPEPADTTSGEDEQEANPATDEDATDDENAADENTVDRDAADQDADEDNAAVEREAEEVEVASEEEQDEVDEDAEDENADDGGFVLPEVNCEGDNPYCSCTTWKNRVWFALGMEWTREFIVEDDTTASAYDTIVYKDKDGVVITNWADYEGFYESSKCLEYDEIQFKLLIEDDFYSNRDSPVRGRNDGSDRENALYTSLINTQSCGTLDYVKLDLWTFIAKVAKKDEYELHGDTVAYFRGPIGQFIRYGFCIYQDLEVTVDEETQVETQEKVWDCQQIDVTVPGSFHLQLYKQRYEYQFTVTDWQYKGEKKSFNYENVKRTQATKMVRDEFE